MEYGMMKRMGKGGMGQHEAKGGQTAHTSIGQEKPHSNAPVTSDGQPDKPSGFQGSKGVKW